MTPIQPLRGLIPLVEAEFVLGLRVASRHPIARSALTWTIGLAAILRIVTGPATPGPAVDTVVGLAGLLAAAVAPPAFVLGGPFEALRWTRGHVHAATCARLAAVVSIAALGALAAGAILGTTTSVLGRVVLHAAVIAALAATLAPAVGCAPATVTTLLLVATGVGVTQLSGASPLQGVLPPPGALLAVDPPSAGAARAALLAGWAGLGMAGVASLAGRARCRAGGRHAGL